MDQDLRDKIKRATDSSGIEKSDFVALLRLVDKHYDKMEATITQSLTTTTPVETIFDSVTEALMSVSDSGAIRICNKVCAKYFGLTKDQIIGSQIEHLLPGAKDQNITEFLQPFMSDPDDTHFESSGGDVDDEQSSVVGGVTVKFCCENCKAKVDSAATDEAKIELVFGAKGFPKAFAKN